ncbi:MAG: ABC transporter ATP-binding protein [Tissierellia bacterium]|nr:ABC transporter ATP-binding protein [Tissierellia bacterium]
MENGLIILLAVFTIRLPMVIGFGVNSWASEKASNMIQMDLVKKWIYRNLDKDSKYTSGDIMTRLTNDSDVLSHFYFQGFGLTVVEPILLGIMSMIVIYRIDSKFLIASILIGGISSGISLLFTNKIKTAQNIRQDYSGRFTDVFSENLRNILTVKTMNLKATRIDKFDYYSEKEIDMWKRTESYQILLKNLSLLTELINLLISFIIGFYIVGFNFTNILIIVQMQVFVNSMLSNFGNMWNFLATISVYTSRIFEVIDHFEDSSNLVESDIKLEDEYDIEMSDINYSYGDNKVLNGVNMRLETGKITVILGETGSGKSTLFDIISGFKSDYSGNYNINGMDFREYSRADKYKLIKLFEQTPALFNVSVRDNIQIASKNALDDDMLSLYADRVGMNRLKDLSERFETEIGELGTSFSGGEKQRIALMRLFPIKAPIILLDEPTSSLDSLNEELVCKAISEEKSGKIILIISHRMKLLEIADEIYVLKDGEFIENGSYEELINEKGYFYKHYYKQTS